MSRHSGAFLHEDRDLYLVVAMVALGSGCAVVDLDPKVLPALFASPLVLLLPGYALVEALRAPDMDVVKRLVISIATSLAVVVLAGIALNWAPGGIDRVSELSSLSGITVTASAVAWIRRRRHRHDVKPATRTGGVRLKFKPGIILSCVAAIALTAAGLGVARQAAIRQQRIDSPTQLWLLPGTSDPNSVNIGVKNADRGRSRYRLVLEDGTTVVREWPLIDLQPGATWTTKVEVPAMFVDHRLQAVLYLSGKQSRYRRVAEPEKG